MAAVARLKAMMGMDAGPYRAGVRDIQGQNQGLKSSFASIGRAIGVAFSVGAIVRMGRALVDWASDLSVSARNVGLLTSEMMALRQVAVQTGLETRQMEQLMARLQTELFQAARGSEQSAKKFADLGLSVADLAAMRPADMLEAVSRAAFATGTPLGALADLFGQRLGPQAMTALRDIAENGLPAVDRAIGEQADKIEELTSKWAVLKETASGALVSIAHGFLDATGQVGRFLGALPHRGVKGALAAMDEGRGVPDQTGRGDPSADLVALTAKTAEDAAIKRLDVLFDALEREELLNKQGLERIEEEYKRHLRELEQALAASSESERWIVDKTIEERKKRYDRDVANFKAAEEQKIQAAQDAAYRQAETVAQRLAEREASVGARTRGRGADVSAMAQIGGMFGGQRPELAVADKQLRVQQELREINREMADNVRQLHDRLDEIAAQGSRDL